MNQFLWTPKERCKLGAKVEADGEVPYTAGNGVVLRLVPFYHDHKEIRREIWVDDTKIGCQVVKLPYTFLKPLTEFAWIWLDKTDPHKVGDVLGRAGIRAGHAMDDPYAEPTRWHACLTGEELLEDVAKVYAANWLEGDT